MTIWIIVAFFVGALFGGVVMSCLVAGGRAEEGKGRFSETVDNRFSAKNKGESIINDK